MGLQNNHTWRRGPFFTSVCIVVICFTTSLAMAPSEEHDVYSKSVIEGSQINTCYSNFTSTPLLEKDVQYLKFFLSSAWERFLAGEPVDFEEECRRAEGMASCLGKELEEIGRGFIVPQICSDKEALRAGPSVFHDLCPGPLKKMAYYLPPIVFDCRSEDICQFDTALDFFQSYFRNMMTSVRHRFGLLTVKGCTLEDIQALSVLLPPSWPVLAETPSQGPLSTVTLDGQVSLNTYELADTEMHFIWMSSFEVLFHVDEDSGKITKLIVRIRDWPKTKYLFVGKWRLPKKHTSVAGHQFWEVSKLLPGIEVEENLAEREDDPSTYCATSSLFSLTVCVAWRENVLVSVSVTAPYTTLSNEAHGLAALHFVNGTTTCGEVCNNHRLPPGAITVTYDSDNVPMANSATATPVSRPKSVTTTSTTQAVAFSGSGAESSSRSTTTFRPIPTSESTSSSKSTPSSESMPSSRFASTTRSEATVASIGQAHITAITASPKPGTVTEKPDSTATVGVATGAVGPVTNAQERQSASSNSRQNLPGSGAESTKVHGLSVLLCMLAAVWRLI